MATANSTSKHRGAMTVKRSPRKSSSVAKSYNARKQYNGVAIPMMASCQDGICDRLDVILNKKHLGVIKHKENGWRLTDVPQGLTNAIAEKIINWYQ